MSRSIVSMLAGTFVLRVSTAITGGMLIYFFADLAIGSGELSIMSGGFYVAELVGAIGFGILADIVGRKLIMVLGPVFGGVAVFMTGLTTFLPALFATRLLEGSSTAASVPSTLGFVAVETSHDAALRSRVVAWFELVSLGGMLAVGPALAGRLYDEFGRTAFFINVGFYALSFALYAYGVSEAPRERRAREPHGGRALTLGRYFKIMSNRQVLRFAPTWLAINAILGLWAVQGQFLLAGGGHYHDSSQWLMQDFPNSYIGYGAAILAVFFGLGILFWGNVFGRARRTNLLLAGVGAFAVAAADVLAINHFAGTSPLVLAALTVVLLGCIFVMSGATPAALGLLADVSEDYHQERRALMGRYSVFLGVGQVLGIVIGGIAAAWRGIDGLIVATVGLLVIGLLALLNLRAHEHALSSGRAALATSAAALLPESAEKSAPVDPRK
jgi:MFS family permease